METKIKAVFTHIPNPFSWKNNFAHAKKVALDKAALWLNSNIETPERVGRAESWVGITCPQAWHEP